jgi:lipopolysaccharide transport system permease protein
VAAVTSPSVAARPCSRESRRHEAEDLAARVPDPSEVAADDTAAASSRGETPVSAHGDAATAAADAAREQRRLEPPADLAHVRREARPGWRAVDFAELWRYRELFYFQALRDIKIRYKQTVLGAAWAVLQPVLTMIVFTLFFGRLGKIPSGGVPYPITTYCALLPWVLFAYALTQASNSLVDNANMITKVYFPRLILPVAATLSGLVDFGISFVFLLGIMGYYGIAPSLAIVTLPLFVLLAIAAALAVGFWLSALNVQYRDVRYVIPFLTQFWLFLTPIAYQTSLVPERWRAVYAVNPMVGVVDGFRWALLGQARPGWTIFISAGAALLLLVGGAYYFRRTERRFADVI